MHWGHHLITSPNKVYLKIPTNLQISILDKKDYCRYLWFKLMDREGIIHKSLLKGDRCLYNYWMSELVKRGWVLQTPTGYQLRAYQHVWSDLKVDKTTTKSRVRFKYTILYSFKTTPREFLADCLDKIHTHQASRKKKQIIHRLLKNKLDGKVRNRATVDGALFEVKCLTKPVFTSTGAAKLFGYESNNDGLTMLKRYFKVDLDQMPFAYKYLNCKGAWVWGRTSWCIHLD